MDFLDSFRPIRAKWLKTSKRMPFTLANVSYVKQTTIVIIARKKWERERKREKHLMEKKHTENMNAKYKHEMQRHATPPLNHWYENRCRCKGVPLQRKNTNHSIKCVEYFWKVSIARYKSREFTLNVQRIPFNSNDKHGIRVSLFLPVLFPCTWESLLSFWYWLILRIKCVDVILSAR